MSLAEALDVGLNKKKVLKALLRYNYFPTQKKKYEEIPPCFSSSKFTPRIARKIIEQADGRNGKMGYDSVQIRATRFNNIPRILEIPHPKPYAALAFYISEFWDHLEHISQNARSMVRPHRQKDDPRIVVMDYDIGADKTHRFLTSGIGKKFMVSADIANCFPSMYSHAIPWALLGFDRAKEEFVKKKQDRSLLCGICDILDMRVRDICRNETKGVPIGPATSNIASELILSAVDRKMEEKGYDFFRYIDDYSCFTSTTEEAEDFTIDLTKELRVFKLALNAKKTEIIKLPQPVKANWVVELGMELPESNELTFSQVCTYLDFALNMAERHPDGSVLKYAVKAISGKVKKSAKKGFLEYLFNLGFHYPIIIPFIDGLIEELHVEADLSFETELHSLLEEHMRHHRSDAMAWILYYMITSGVVIEDATLEKLISSADCLALCVLLLDPLDTYKRAIKRFVNTIDKKDEYHCDQYWLLLYEAFFRGWIRAPHHPAFEVLKENKVSFVAAKKKRKKKRKSLREKRA